MKKPIPFGKYLLLERVNVGGMAEVFLGKAFGVEGFERLMAIKRILPTMVEDSEFITMFLDEARISVQLNHANIVQIYELGKHDESYYIAMEYVSGKDLRHLLERYRKRKETMPTAQAVLIASKICEGLDYAHRKKDARGMDLNIVHRDVSPQNILLSFDGEVKIIDFGIAKAANRAQKTQAGILKGKFGYMSPEQVRGLPIDHRSDLFAVGVILYEMLTGERLFVGESDFSTLEKVRNAEVLPPRQYNAQIPEGLEKIILKALAKEVEDRYQWCSDFQEDLMRFLMSGDQIYTGKQLGTFMKEAFVEDLKKEQERLERIASVSKPEQVETTGLTASRRMPVAPPVGARKTGPAMPAAAAPPADDPFQAADPGDGEQPSADRTEVFRSPFADSAKAARGQRRLGDDDEDTATPASEPPTLHGAEAPTQFDGGDDNLEVAKTMIGLTSPLAAPPTKSSTKVRKAPVDEPEPGAAQSYGGETVMGVRPPAPPRKTKGAVAVAAPAPELEPEQTEDLPPDETGPATLVPQKKAGSKLPLIVGGAVLAVVVAVGAMLALKPKNGTLTLKVQPASAQVSVSGKAAKNGSQLELPAGEYEVQARAAGYLARKQKVTLAAGAAAQVDFALEQEPPPEPEKPPEPKPEPGAQASAGDPKPPEPAGNREPPKAEPTPEAKVEKAAAPDLKVESEPAGADIEINGKKQGKTPKTLKGLDPAKVTSVKLTMRGYKPSIQPVEWRKDAAEVAVVAILDKEEAKAALPKPPREVQGVEKPVQAVEKTPKAPPAPKGFGKLISSSTPVAKVLIDGKDSGRYTPIAPVQPLEIAAGEHTITYVADDGRKATRSVTVGVGEQVRVTGVNDFQ